METRRSFLRLMLATAGATALAACQPKAPTGTNGAAAQPGTEAKPAAPGKTQISWFDWDIGSNAPQKMAEMFMEDYPNIAVEVQGAPGGEYYERVQTLAAAGIAPDVLNFQSWRWQPFAKRGVIGEIADLVERDNWTTPFHPRWATLWEPQTYFRGKLYTQPYNTAPMVMFYIKEPFDRLGIPYPTDNWTVAEFKELAEKLTYEEGGTKHYGYQSNISYERLACWMRMEGKKEWDTENEPTEANWLEPTVVEALEWQLYDCFNTIKCSPTPADMQGGANQLQTGSAAMKMEGAWFLPQMQGPTAAMEGGVEFDVVAMPTGGAGKVHMGFAHVQTLNAATKHKEEAWSLLKYIGDEKAQRVWSEMTGRQPNNPDFIEKFWVPKAKEDFNFQNAEAFVKAMDTGIVHVTGLYDIEIYNEVFNPFRDEVVAGYSRAADLLPGVNQALQDMIDEYWAS